MQSVVHSSSTSAFSFFTYLQPGKLRLHIYAIVEFGHVLILQASCTLSASYLSSLLNSLLKFSFPITVLINHYYPSLKTSDSLLTLILPVYFKIRIFLVLAHISNILLFASSVLNLNLFAVSPQELNPFFVSTILYIFK